MQLFKTKFMLALALLASCSFLPARAGAGGGGGTPTNTTQMRSWLFTSQRIDFSSGTAVASTQIAAGQPNATDKRVAASVFNGANQLLFYVTSDGGRSIYSANNVLLGALNGVNPPDKAYDESGWFPAPLQTAIVPVPGLCQRYYIIYPLISNYSAAVGYAEMDCSGTTPVLVSNTRYTDPATASNGQPTAFRFYPGGVGIAVSRLRADGTRYLYSTAGGIVRRVTLLNGGGFGNGITVPNTAGAGGLGGRGEVELSPDSNTLAYVGSVGGIDNVCTLDLSSSGGPLPISNSGNASGLEFSADSKRLFVVGGPGGAGVYNVITRAKTPITGTYGSNAQIELAFDGNMYSVGTNGVLMTVNPTTLAVSTPALPTIDQVFSNPVSGYFLPDQIDGEDYSLNVSSDPPSVSLLVIDGQNINASTTPAVYGCNPLMLNGRLSYNLTNLTVTVTKTDANDVPLGNYQRTVSYAALPASLAAFDGGYLTQVANVGYYRIVVAGRNTCGATAQATGRVWLSTLTPTSVSFGFNGCSGSAVPATGTSVGSPTSLGAYGGGGIDISNTTGDYDSYQVQFASYAAGAYTNLGALTSIVKPGVLTTIALSYLAGQVGLAPNYFQIGQPGYNQVFRLTLTVSNQCGTSPALSGHFRVDNISCRPAGGGGVVVAMATPPEVRAYPNPLPGGATGHLAFALPAAQRVSLVLVDGLTGQPRQTLLREAWLEAGAQDVPFDLTGLPAGLYGYRLNTAAGTVAGRISKPE